MPYLKHPKAKRPSKKLQRIKTERMKEMKRLISMLLVIVMIAGCTSVTNVFASDISVTINGEKQSYDVMPVIENGRTLVPMRGIFEALGAAIYWDDATKTVTAKKSGKTITLVIGENNDRHF